MNLNIREYRVSSVLNRSGIQGVDYCINPYVGCSHRCLYCYATFMKRFTGHTEPWGTFVDIKINAPECLERQLRKADRGTIMISSVTDAYQPVEAGYRLTRKCLEILLENQFPVTILTKSPLVLRDLDLFTKFQRISVGLTISTSDEKTRKIFEPNAPPIGLRIQALKTLFEKGIETYAFIGPVLPMDPRMLVEKIRPFVRSVLIDRMNYTKKTESTYRRIGMGRWNDSKFIDGIIHIMENEFKGKEVTIC